MTSQVIGSSAAAVTAASGSSHQKNLPQSPRPTSPFTPPATGEAKIGQGRRSRASSEEDAQITCNVEEDQNADALRHSRKRQRTVETGRLRLGSVESAHSYSSEASSSISSGSSSSAHSPLSGHVDGDYYSTVNDTPHNPFLRGAPADLGFSGTDLARAHHRKMFVPAREIGRMTYVFRGQRVTYADPYASDSDSEDGSAHMLRTMQRTKDRLRPKLLFPDAHATARMQEAATTTRHARDMAALSSASTSDSSRTKSSYRDHTLFGRSARTDTPMTDGLEAPVAQLAKSPARSLLGLCQAAEHVQQQQQYQNQSQQKDALTSTDAPWLHAELMLEQDRLRQQVNLNPLSRELLARMDGTNWTDDDDAHDAMDHDAHNPWHTSTRASSGHLAQSLGFAQPKA